MSASTSNLLRLLALTLVCAAAGWGAGRLVPPAEAPMKRHHSTMANGRASKLGKDERPASATTQQRIDALKALGEPSAQIGAVLDFASLDSVEEIRELLENGRYLPPHAAQSMANGVLLRRWLELDPDGALEHCRVRHSKDLPLLLQDCATIDPDKAEAFLAKLPSGASRTEAWAGICGVLALRDPERVWALLSSPPTGSMSSSELGAAVADLFQGDADAYLRRLEALPPSVLKSARSGAVAKLMESNPAKAWEWARNQPNAASPMAAALGVVIGKNPAQAMELLASLSPQQFKEIEGNHGYELFSRAGAEAEEALRRSTGLSAERMSVLASRAIDYLSYKYSQTAAKYLDLIKDSSRESRISNLVGTWKRKDEAGLAQWMASLPPGPDADAADKALKSTRETVESDDNPAGKPTFSDLLASAAKGGGSNQQVKGLSGSQFRELMAAVPADKNDRRNQFLQAAEPTVALRWLAQAPEADPKFRVTSQSAARWAQRAPEEAAAWVSSLPANDFSKWAAKNVAMQYAQHDPEAARRWAQSLPATTREAALKSIEAPE